MKLKHCPFCGTKPPDDLIDNLYPTGIYFRRQPGGYKSYHSSNEVLLDTDKCMYKYICDGCDVEMHGHSEAEVLYKWNKRIQ